MENLTRLGEELRRTSDQISERDPALRLARERLFSQVAELKAGRPWLALAAALALGVLLVVGVRGLFERKPLGFEVGRPPHHGLVGEWLAAEQTELPVRFSEGTQLTLSPGSRMRVAQTTSRGAEVVIEHGNVLSHVVHHDAETHWAVCAGPFHVRVTGTKFDTSWEPSSETFSLIVHEGSVVVTGPALSAPRHVKAGERLSLSLRDQNSAARASSQPAQHAVANAATAVLGTESVAPGAAGPEPSVARYQPSWQMLAERRQYREALAAVEQAGFQQELQRASAHELSQLADAARLAGDATHAEQTLLALRQRFAARGQSAFLLGKIAADQQADTAKAVRWFETYLDEQPRGALTEQALGRLVELEQSLDRATARSLAARYLQSFPGGSYAALARSLIGD